jgi:HEAT repeat protein
MQRIIGLAVAAMMVSGSGESPLAVAAGSSGTAGGFVSGSSLADVTALLTSARGAPPMICALAAQSVRRWGWGGDWNDAPSTPLRAIVSAVNDHLSLNSGKLPPEDIERLMAGLASDDACVRELAVRILGTQKDEPSSPVARGLIVRLVSNDASLREVAALGLGYIEPSSAIDPLIRALRDASPAVRANSAWALGRIEVGRALRPLIDLFDDDATLVREAAIVAVGRMESTSTVPALIRVVRQDDAPSVRRVAAWALGNIESREAVQELARALGQDADARVREMSAWALGNIEDKSGSAALSNAARRDADDRVRETAVWALGQLEDRSSVEILGQIAGSDRSSRVRGTAAWAIGQLDGRGMRAPAGLLQALKDESEDTRVKAAWALGELGDPNALPAIREALRAEKGEQMQRALIRALMESGGRSETELTSLLNSSDPRVREAAVRGLAGKRSFNPWPWPWPRPRPFP